MPETLIYQGGALKTSGEGKIAGYLVLYGDEQNTDLVRDFFAPDTDFDLTGEDRRYGYYDHGLDVKFRNHKIGVGVLSKQDLGVWLEAQLDLRDEYAATVYALAEKGALGLSSGALSHLVRREPVGKSFKVTHWPIGEWSCTVVPAEPRTQVTTLKSYRPDAADTVQPAEAQVSPVAALKGLFEAELANRTMQVYDLWSTLSTVFEKIAAAAKAADVTGSAPDVPSLVTEAVTSFSARIIPAVTAQINAFAESSKEDRFWLKSALETLTTLNPVSGAGQSYNLKLTDHSNLVVSAVKEYAEQGAVLGESLSLYAQRAKDKQKFRSETKAGRTISAANRELMEAGREQIQVAVDAMQAIDGTLADLIALATPKAQVEAEAKAAPTIAPSLPLSLYAEFLHLEARGIVAPTA